MRDGMSLINCPVCWNYQDTGPMMTCSNGHFVCQTCLTKLTVNRKRNCPTCRNPDININPFARLMANILGETEMATCRYLPCKETGTTLGITTHENICIQRPVECPAAYRGLCQWTGNQAQLLEHLKPLKEEQNFTNAGHCVVLVRTTNNEPFRATISDFSSASDTPSLFFSRETTTHWKPIVFTQGSLAPHLVYLTVIRASGGQWHFQFRHYQRMIPGAELKTQLRIWPYSCKNRKNKILPRYVFNGTSIYNEIDNVDAWKMGNCLTLSDPQVLQLREVEGAECSGNKGLLCYEVSLSLSKIP